MSNIATVFGGSGFLGRYVCRALAQEGWRVRVAVRRPNEAIFVRLYGTPGQVEPVLCNIRDDNSVRSAMADANVVVNCIGILNEIGANAFDAIQHLGAVRVAKAASELGVARLVHVSALGADEQSSSEYCQSKARGENGVLDAFPKAVIVRPSAMFGCEDRFFNKFAGMCKFGPILPIVGGDTVLQPVYVDDVARAVVMAARGDAAPGTYELGGPAIVSMREIVATTLGHIHRRRLVLDMPFWAASIVGRVLDMGQTISFGLVPNRILTRDQVKSLSADNVVGANALGFSDMGIQPVSMESILPEYLWVYRPSGEFAAIKNSAQNLGGKA